MMHLMPRSYMMQSLFAQPDMAEMPIRRGYSGGAIIRFIFPFLDLNRHGHKEMMGGLKNDPILDKPLNSQLSEARNSWKRFDFNTTMW
jgi:hypothetical protein